MGSCLSSVTRYNIIINMKFLVVVSALASMCMADAEADAEPQLGLHGVHNLAEAPYLGYHNALPAVAPVAAAKLQLPLYNPGYAGLGYAGYNPWVGAGYGYGYGLNGLNSPYAYGRFGGLAHGYAGYPYYG